MCYQIVNYFLLHEKLTKSYVKGKVEGEMALLHSLRAQLLRKAQKISRPLPLVSGEAHNGGGPRFPVKSGLVPGFSGGSEYSVTPDTKYVVTAPYCH